MRSKCSVPSRLPKMVFTFLIFPVSASRTAHLSVLGVISLAFFGELSKLWTSPTKQFLETAPTTFSYFETPSAKIYFQTPSIRRSRFRSSRCLGVVQPLAWWDCEFINVICNNKYRISWTSVQWHPSCSTRSGRQTYTGKLIVAFRNFANEPKNRNLRLAKTYCIAVNIQNE
jgi:hypothetical protein